MKVSNLFLFAAIFCFSFVIIGKAQEITGMVMGEDKPSNWQVSVIMTVVGTKNSKKKYPKPNFYGFGTPENAIVNLGFRANSYKSQTIERISVRDGVEMDPVVLQKKGDLLALGKEAEILSGNELYYKTTGDYDGAAYDLIEVKVEADKFSNSEAIKAKVDARFNNLREYMKQVNQPVTLQQEMRWKQFERIIIINNQTQKVNQISPDEQRHYLNLIKDNEVPVDIRYEAIKAFLLSKTNFSPENIEEALGYFREQAKTPKSLIFQPSLFALAKIGTSKDKTDFVLNYARGNDYNSSLAAVETIKDAGMIEGRDTLLSLATDKTKNIIINQAAVEGLENLANQFNDQTSKGYLQKLPVQTKSKLELQNRVVARPQ